MSRPIYLAMTNQDAGLSLPRKPTQDFGRRQLIYGPHNLCNNLYMVRSGRVLISNCFDESGSIVTRIVGPNGLFGEACLIAAADPGESAAVLDQARVMSWSRAEVEQQIARDPRLGMELMGHFVRRCGELNARLEGLAFRRTPERVMLGLLQLAESLGTPAGGGLRLAPLTHQTIAEYIGTSREIVTSHMSEFRRAGMLQYSRKYIDVNVSLMRETLRGQGIELIPAGVPMARTAFQ
ncbi:MAG TPA: Crp/Fnr family transcriptional regulator [Candidatus Acidoferrales bacterium]|nr:Crp/Fnr family transcriptional regulator [Candidatus Acidoferrales bacterium]